MSKKPPKTIRTGAPTEPSPVSETDAKAHAEHQKALRYLSEAARAATEVAKKLDRELVRRKSMPKMPAVRVPLPPPSTKK